MTKAEFLQQLQNHLLPLAAADRDEILADFEEHFQAGLESGKTEAQICQELGNPYSCALQYLRQPGAYTVPQQPSKHATEPPKYNAAAAAQKAVYERRNRTLWSIMFALLVVCAFGVYPTAVTLMASPLIVLLISIFAVAFVPTAGMVGFLVSLCVCLFTAGLFIFLLMTWLLKLSYKRAGF